MNTITNRLGEVFAEGTSVKFVDAFGEAHEGEVKNVFVGVGMVNVKFTREGEDCYTVISVNDVVPQYPVYEDEDMDGGSYYGDDCWDDGRIEFMEGNNDDYFNMDF